MKKLAVIGAGMMGGAIINGIVEKSVLEPKEIFVSDPDKDKVRYLCEKLGINSASSNGEAVQGAETVLIAVKPQFLDEALQSIKDSLSKDTLIMTIAAGVPTAHYLESLDCRNIIRIMPNTPAQVGEGVCGWYTVDGVSEEQQAFCEKILAALGVNFKVRRESDLNLVTAVSGSGPAYVYLFIEAMTDAAVQLGLPRPLSEKIVLQTVLGSAAYMKAAGKHPVILKNEVTSPGGTTAAALAMMEKEGLRTAVTDGMIACLQKTIELGKK